jgi:hypothetical protein
LGFRDQGFGGVEGGEGVQGG